MTPEAGIAPSTSSRPIQAAVAVPLMAEAAAPGRRLLAAVSGVAGSGKSALLDRLAARYRLSGVEVRRDHVEGDASAGAARRAVLVDDAHRLPEETLAHLQSLIEHPHVDLVVAFGHGSHPPALRRLARSLDQHHAPIVLGPLTPADIAAHIAESVEGAAVPGYLDALHELTGGMPWLVQRLVDEADRDDDGVLRRAVSPYTLDQLGRELDLLPAPLHGLLLALAVGFEPSLRLPTALAAAGEDLGTLMERAREDGMLLPDGRLIPLVRQVLLTTTPTYRLRALQHELVETMANEGRSLDGVARDLARAGVRDPRIALALEAAGDRALVVDPAVARALFDEALSAGADPLMIGARRGQAAAACGDLGTAARIVDELLARDTPHDLLRAVDVAAAVWAQRGLLSRGADIYRWLGPERAGPSASLAVVVMTGCGDGSGAEAMRKTASSSASPTMVGVALTLMSEGIRESLDPRTTRALPALIRSSDVLTASRSANPLPDTPAAIGAIVALNSGDVETARTVLSAALEGGQGGTAARSRLLLLSGWVAMQGNEPELARTAIGAVDAIGRELVPRDELLLRALELGLARRADDAPSLVAAWHRARQCALHVAVDLFSLLPLGELMIVAARLKDSDRLAPHLSEAWALLGRLGEPPLWSAPLHWCAVQAAVLAERPDDLARHLEALVGAAPHSEYAALTAAAGRVWPAVLAGVFDVAEVESAARGLVAIGSAWEGSRLVGHAAARAPERKDMARLLSCARDLHPGDASQSGSRGGNGDTRRRPTGSPARLSDRERQIARLVLDGKTYWEIGESIFISPRTVEHHVARIRRRLGVDSRSELLARLQLELQS